MRAELEAREEKDEVVMEGLAVRHKALHSARDEIASLKVRFHCHGHCPGPGPGSQLELEIKGPEFQLEIKCWT